MESHHRIHVEPSRQITLAPLPGVALIVRVIDKGNINLGRVAVAFDRLCVDLPPARCRRLA